jgi:adenine-specific DNA-methyltransferase
MSVTQSRRLGNPRSEVQRGRERPGGESAEGSEQHNLILDERFTKQGYSSKDSEFGLIYVDGDNTLANLKVPDDTWKVRLIEEDCFRLMFDTEVV